MISKNLFLPNSAWHGFIHFLLEGVFDGFSGFGHLFVHFLNPISLWIVAQMQVHSQILLQNIQKLLIYVIVAQVIFVALDWQFFVLLSQVFNFFIHILILFFILLYLFP